MKARKKAGVILVIVSMMLSVFLPAYAEADQTENRQRAPYKTTVMVYLCGSNLESWLGAATKDLYEMMRSGFDETCTDVVVMAGGSKSWKNGLNPDRTSIIELHGLGMRPVWQSEEPLNMSEAATLGTFLDYVYGHYQSDRYALILWDHGGGPNEGACYDELFPGQSLALSEIRDAFREQDVNSYGRQLSWIGFDACLMANLETAYMLRPYADYLIASQAEEPSTGWNYAFLKGLESDPDSEATSRRIIDCFVEQAADSNTPLTLSCIRLGDIRPVLNSVNRLFEAQVDELSGDTFPVFSNDRYRMLDFGSTGEKGAGSFDLVDLYSLAEAYGGGTPELGELKEALENAVVYSRSTVESASGLSVYHPYYDPDCYHSSWADSYARYFSDMSRSYARFIRYFNQIQTGESLTSWPGLQTERSVDPDGSIRFSVTLSEEQAEHFVHADLRVLDQMSSQNLGYSDSYKQIWQTADVRLNEDRTISAVFPGKKICVVDDLTGEVLADRLDFVRTDDEKFIFYVYVLFSDENGILDDELLAAEYRCAYQPKTDTVTVDSVCARDELTGEYSTRMTLDEEFFRQSDYTTAMFWHDDITPVYRGGELPGLRDWEDNGNIHYIPVSLPRNWHFEIRNIEEPSGLTCAIFQITDAQNTKHCSSLTRVYPELTGEYGASCCVSGDLPELSVTDVSIQSFLDEDGLFLQARLEGLPSDFDHMVMEHVVLNDAVCLPQLSDYAYDNRILLTLKKAMTFDITELRSIAFDLSVRNARYEEKTAHVVAELPEPILLEREGVHALSTCETDDGLRWRICGVEQSASGELRISCDVQNPGKEDRRLSINDVILGPYDSGFIGSPFDLPAGKTAFLILDVSQTIVDADNAVSVITAVYEPLAQLGADSIETIRLIVEDESARPVDEQEMNLEAFAQLGEDALALVRQLYEDTSVWQREEREVSFTLQEPVPCAPVLPERVPERRTISEGVGFRIELGQITPYHDGNTDKEMLSVVLWLHNNSEEAREFRFDRFSVNGLGVQSDGSDRSESSFVTRPDTVRLRFLHLTLPESREGAESLSFDVSVDDVFVQRVTVETDEQHPAFRPEPSTE